MGEDTERLSVTLNVKLMTPAVGGAPLSTPAVKLNHSGNALSVEKVRAPVPPVAVIVTEYGRFTVPDGNGDAFVIAGIGFTSTVYPTDLEPLLVSVAVTVKGNAVAPETAGAMPLSTPPGVRVSHAGSPVAVKAIAPVPPLAVKVCEYKTPEVVGGSAAGEMAIPGFTVNENCRVSDAVALSVAFTPNTKVVGEETAFGIPLTAPAGLSDMPGGGAPLARVHANGGVPPLTLSARVQRLPAVHACRGPVLIAGAGLMVRLKLAVPISFTGSVAMTLAANVPEAAGTPEMPVRAPVPGLTERPSGSPDEVHE